MAIKWIKQTFEWGSRHISGETRCVIEYHNLTGVAVWMEPGKPVREPQPFETVRAAKSYVNSLTPAPTT